LISADSRVRRHRGCRYPASHRSNALLLQLRPDAIAALVPDAVYQPKPRPTRRPRILSPETSCAQATRDVAPSR
jgi:hypothetical protein